MILIMSMTAYDNSQHCMAAAKILNYCVFCFFFSFGKLSVCI